MATRTLAYECKYCGTLKRTKNVCERHELSCLKNPDAKNCIYCEHMKSVEGIKVCAVNGKKCSVAVSSSCTRYSKKKGR